MIPLLSSFHAPQPSDLLHFIFNNENKQTNLDLKGGNTNTHSIGQNKTWVDIHEAIQVNNRVGNSGIDLVPQ